MLQFDKILEQVRKNQESNQIKGDVLLLVKSIEEFPAMDLLLKHKFVPQIISEPAIAPRYTCCILWQLWICHILYALISRKLQVVVSNILSSGIIGSCRCKIACCAYYLLPFSWNQVRNIWEVSDSNSLVWLRYHVEVKLGYFPLRGVSWVELYVSSSIITLVARDGMLN